MRAHIKLGRIFGVEIGLHFSWFIIALLIVLSLAAQYQTTNPDWAGPRVWALSVLTALLFFGCLVMHELAHALVAKARGLRVRAITLFALGGVAQIEDESSSAATEFWVAIVGPFTSAVIGLVCLLIASAAGWTPDAINMDPFASMAGWLGYINVGLAIFNLMPGFPLDGGRVLRAIIWWKTGDVARSTRIAARVGQVVGVCFIAIGLFQFFSGPAAGTGGIWLAFIGWFLFQVAGETYEQVGLLEALRGIRVRDVMTRDCTTIDAGTDLETFVHEYVLPSAERCFIVLELGEPAGIITPGDVRQIDRARWRFTTVEQAMHPLDSLSTVTPDTPVAEAVLKMGRDNFNQLPVFSDGHLEGILSRSQIVQLFRNRAELRV